MRRELGVDVGAIVGAECPPLESGSPEQRAEELATRLGDLGPINPLALEELSALEERHQDLDTQVADVRNARRELQEVVRTLDEEIMQTFASAAADVNEHFSDSSAPSSRWPGTPDADGPRRPLAHRRRDRGAPGGPQRPARLALVRRRALARRTRVLVRGVPLRPSPFYLMDEVEAALDDVNLHRFLGLIDEFRDEAQLVIVSHRSAPWRLPTRSTA